jgi:hypothetical protein
MTLGKANKPQQYTVGVGVRLGWNRENEWRMFLVKKSLSTNKKQSVQGFETHVNESSIPYIYDTMYMVKNPKIAYLWYSTG